ncbi:MAG: SdrD B-like domain-containing protein, partial [Phormidesmis sp.]
DGQGRLFALPNAGASATTIVPIEIVGNSIQTLGDPNSISPARGADAAECVIGRSAIGDRVWDDLDGNGTQELLEPGIANVTVGLYRDVDGDGVLDSGDPLLATQLTNSNGNYDFIDLIFGNYIIKVLEGTPEDVDGTNALEGGLLTTTSTTPGGEAAVTLPPGIIDYNDADFGYQLPVPPQNPNMLLVKRITAINGQTTNPNDSTPLNTVLNDGVADSADDNSNWPASYLVGALNGGLVSPVSNNLADTVEYSIYFLSAGEAIAQNVLVCDRIPQYTNFLPDSYAGILSADPLSTQPNPLGIAFSFNGSEVALTGANDGDAGYYFPANTEPSTLFSDIDCGGTNDNGAVVVDLGDLPPATAAGDPANSFGRLRFQVEIE